MKLPIYLDHNATTPVDGRVFDAMRPSFTDAFGNAASKHHRFGEQAKAAVEQARAQVAALIGAASPDEIVWTSGATESDNLAIKGVAEMYADKGRHLITQLTEHKAVLDTCKYLQSRGWEITFLPVDKTGRVSAEQVAEAIRPQTVLVSIMWANNEVGTIQPIRQIGQVCREKGVWFHTDATQAVGHVPVNVEADFIDLLSFSGHKLYGPKGCGGLYVRKRPRVRLSAQMHGGGHERGFRSGTLNVPGIVGVGAACAICQQEMSQAMQRESQLRDRLEKTILEQLDFVTVNGNREHRLPHTTNLSFAFAEGESILLAMERNGIAVSSGSACTSESLEPSYVLRAMGVPADLAHCSIRISLGRSTTAEEIDYAAGCFVREVHRLREMSPLYEMAQEGVDLSKVQWAER